MEKHKCRIGFWENNYIGYDNDRESGFFRSKQDIPTEGSMFWHPDLTYELFNFCPDCGKKLR